CEFETECSIWQKIVSDAKALKSAELRFYADRSHKSTLSEEEVTARLNSTLKAAFPSDAKLEKLMMNSGYGDRYGSKIALDEDATKALRSSLSIDPPKNKKAKTTSAPVEE
ncbi:MAG: hypothetical protein SGARI_005639, partial [Bacillariaceae sp.]